ncbi:hypothetical protein A4A49_66143 [Nicotiana attenuata]|uniref:Chromo domain-containing protein n=1 Tax=Nicotiana attenuata TaxID=49451 RepID=A0A1J6JMC5_NICAT|nr:hypothetical protein A4A49_53366 [Nicotiana attenuata]OIT18925.1 hypothetical protein A4A49_66143 [Nicotiana attenuata]
MMEEETDSLKVAQIRIKKYADRNRRPLEFKVGGEVLLKLTPIFGRRLTAGLDIELWFYGMMVPLKLLKRLIHPNFPVSYLRTYVEDPEDPDKHKMNRAPPEKILEHRVLGMHKKNRQTQFLIQWKGKPEADTTWEKGASLWQYEQQIEDYLKSASTRASSSTSGGGLLAPNIEM